MAKRIEVTAADGTEGWIDLSASLEKAARTKAWEDNIPPEEALETFLLETFESDEEADEEDTEESDEEADEEDTEESDEEADGEDTEE